MSDLSTDEKAGLPVLDWNAGTAGRVAQDLLRQWHGAFDDVDVRLNCEVKEHKRNGKDLLLICQTGPGFDLVTCDYLLIAVGARYQKLMAPWRDLLDREAENLSHLYG